MVITEKDLRANVLYHAIRGGPILAWCYAFTVASWLMLLLYAILAFVWYRAILVWLHRIGLDLPILGIELLTDIDRCMQIVTRDRHEYIVTACIKIDVPDDLDLFRKFVHSHFMTFRRCRSTIVRIGN